MLAKFWGLMPKVPYLSLEKEKEIFCVVFTYSIKRVREIATTAKKCSKKQDARAKFFYCQSKPIAFLVLARPRCRNSLFL